MKKIYKTIDLCAGIGGIRKGFELTKRFENKISAEIDKYACLTYEHLYGENPINDVSSEEFKSKLETLEYDVLLAGFPCQAFSRAGKQEGFLDEVRGTLFFDIADIISRTKPKAFLLENVDNLLSHKKGETFSIIAKTLVKDLGYKVIGIEEDENGKLIYDRKNFIRNSRNFGIPQNRPRVYIMGFKKNIFDINIFKGSSLPTKREKPIYNDLNDLLEYGNDIKYYLAEGYIETLKKHKKGHSAKGNGFGYEVVNRDGKGYSNAILATGGSGKERNLVYDPQDGVAGKIVKGKQTPLNSEGIRMMSPREWGKLQGFINYAFVNDGVDTFSFPSTVSATQQYKQFGNSVTIPVMEEMAKYMIGFLDTLRNEK